MASSPRIETGQPGPGLSRPRYGSWQVWCGPLARNCRLPIADPELASDEANAGEAELGRHLARMAGQMAQRGDGVLRLLIDCLLDPEAAVRPPALVSLGRGAARRGQPLGRSAS